MRKALSSGRRSELRAEAHKLHPIVLIGDKGLTDEVLAEIDRSLKAHELIKVRAAGGDRAARSAWMEAICTRLEAHAVQLIGKVLVVYRQNPLEPPAKGPRPKKPAPAAPAPAPAVKRSARPRSRTPSPRPESAPRRRRPSTSR
jgi:putative YhbY family RNA-binding protein